MMDLRKFGASYPFLQSNLNFWEKYLTAREEVLQLLPAILDEEKLQDSSFLANMDKGQPFFAFENIRLTAKDREKLVQAFCKPLDLPVHDIALPERMPLVHELTFEANERGFITAELHAAIAAYIESVIANDEEAINWLEPTCPICGATAGMGLIAPSGKKNLVCSHCQAVWVYLRTACGICGHSNEKGAEFYTADEEPDWLIEPCVECQHYLKVCDMRHRLPDIVSYPLHYLTSWNMDISMREKPFTPAFFAIFTRAGWLQGH